MATQENGQSRPKCTAPELLLKIILTGTLGHFETPRMIDEKRLEHMLHAGKQILYKSHQESEVRYVFVKKARPMSTGVSRRLTLHLISGC